MVDDGKFFIRLASLQTRRKTCTEEGNVLRNDRNRLRTTYELGQFIIKNMSVVLFFV